MGGGLLQLVAYGAQDAYLSANPQITFWKGLYKRHTNFAMEAFRVSFTGQQSWGTKQSATVGRHADLLYSTYLEVVLPGLNRDGSQNQLWNDDQDFLGFNLFKYVELEIGGQLIDRLYGEWLVLWSILTNDYNKVQMLNDMASARQYQAIQLNAGSSSYDYVGDFPAPYGCTPGYGRPSAPNVLYIPLHFFYTKNPGVALPLIALQYHEVKVNILWNIPELVTGDYINTKHKSPPLASSVSLYIDYIYLDVEERRRMAQQSHEYLIEQTQFNETKGIASASNRVDLTFNHPVKELVWVVQPANYTDCKLPVWDSSSGTAWNPLTDPPARPQNDDMNYYRGGGYSTYDWNSGTGGHGRLQPFTYDTGPIYQQKLQINGQDRMDARYGDYFNRVQPWQHHSGNTVNYPGIYCYSFALRPEEHQPSGTCNFSRIDTAHLVMDFVGEAVVDESRNAVWNVRVYAVNYNVLRIMSGMAGLSYSN